MRQRRFLFNDLRYDSIGVRGWNRSSSSSKRNADEQEIVGVHHHASHHIGRRKLGPERCSGRGREGRAPFRIALV